MKVKCYVCRHEEIEVEIPDEFRRLAQPHPWEDPECTAEMYEECCKAVEEATGLPFGERSEDEHIVFNPSYIEAVWSAENDMTMMED